MRIENRRVSLLRLICTALVVKAVRFWLLFFAVGGFGTMLAGTATGDIVEIDQFTGALTEDFNGFSEISDGVANTELAGFSGFAILSVDTGSLKLERVSTRNGDTVSAMTDPRMLLSFGTVDWNFSRPVSQFGAYFENNSDVDGGTIEFYGLQDQFLGTRPIDVPASGQLWTWNGWRSDDPIARITTRGNSELFDHGFFFYEDVQLIQAVPEPRLGWLVMAAFLVQQFACRRRI